jgi:hypothetical protein
MKRHILFCTTVILALSPVAQAALSGTTLITDARIAALKTRIANRTQPTYNAYLALKSYVDAHLNDPCRAPAYLYIPSSNVDPVTHDKNVALIRDDSILAYKLALAYRLTGNETYAANSARILNCWTKVTFSPDSNTKLIWSTFAPSMIVAADLVKRSVKFTATQQQTFKSFARFKSLPMNTMNIYNNNGGDWGLLLVVSTAAYLQDQTLFNSAVARWKYFISTQISASGEMIYETHRSSVVHAPQPNAAGIFYSNYSLHPKTEAAAIMKVKAFMFSVTCLRVGIHSRRLTNE